MTDKAITKHFGYDETDETGFETGEFWARRDRAIDERIAGDAAYNATSAGKLEALQRKADAMRLAHGDHGAHSPEEIAAIDAEAAAIRDQIAAETAARFAAEWTIETTAARRAEWNAAVKAGTFTGRDGKVRYDLIRTWETPRGWTHESLKAAVAAHGL